MYINYLKKKKPAKICRFRIFCEGLEKMISITSNVDKQNPCKNTFEIRLIPQECNLVLIMFLDKLPLFEKIQVSFF